jgi:hypothetical protein
MGLGQLPPQSAAPVVMNVAGGLRVEVFLGVEFRGYFADIRVAEVSCRLPGRRDQFGAGFAMSMGPPVCH